MTRQGRLGQERDERVVGSVGWSSRYLPGQDAHHAAAPRLPENGELGGGGQHRSLLEAYGVS
jgi:hypothetical protein